MTSYGPAIKKLVATYFKNRRGEPYQLTDGQVEIFRAITHRGLRWVWISGPTRYGKTEVIAIAIIVCCVFYKLKVPVVGGSEEKAKKIMEYIIQHLGDHPTLYAGLLNIQDIHDVDRLKVTVSKDALRWRDGGWVYVTSVDARSRIKEGEGVVGEGGDIVILEEAGLIKSKEQFSKIVRMPEEDGGWGKLVQSGNCIEGSVFEEAYNNQLYYKVRIDLEQAIAEGRYTREYVEEKKTQTTAKDWKRYWLVMFPEVNEFTYFKPQKYNLLPTNLKYFGAMDPALGKSKTGSKIGISVVGVSPDNAIRYEVETLIDHMLPDEAVRRVFNMPYKFDKFVIESVMFQEYFLKITNEKGKELGRGITFEGLRQFKNKNVRIESMEPDINNGRVLFKGDNQLWQDMQDYPNTEYLDGLDALQMALEASAKPSAKVAIGDDVF